MLHSAAKFWCAVQSSALTGVHGFVLHLAHRTEHADLPTELVHRRQHQTRAEARRDVFAHIDGFNNRIRRQSGIGYVSPIEMEAKSA
jgi:hypothetical protein